MTIDGQLITTAMPEGDGSFVGILSDDVISAFNLVAIAGTPTVTTAKYQDQDCGHYFTATGIEFCLESADITRTAAMTLKDFTGMYIAGGEEAGGLLATRSFAAFATPEPATEWLMLTAGVLALTVLRRIRNQADRNSVHAYVAMQP
jgi:hypothetical protein